MARNAGTSVENNFVNGLVTEATGLNFPENAVTDCLNIEFDTTGTVTRRRGIDLEDGYNSLTISGSTSDAFVEFEWKGVAGDGQRNFLVQQVGSQLLFFRNSGTPAISTNFVGSIDISPNALATGPTLTENFCQFASGLGYLIVVHPHCETFFVTFDPVSSTFTQTQFKIKTRDFRGVDPQDIPRQGTITSTHMYNLVNQGWSVPHVYEWYDKIGNYPSDYDVWWLYKSPDAFGVEQFLTNTAVSGNIVNNVNRGNSPAPKGSVIFTEFYQDREAATGVNPLPLVSAGNNRPSTAVFHAGRIFYSGVNANEYTSKIYFSQIIEHTTQFEKCYQANDPTSQYSPDLLPTDGGVIAIPDAGRIYKITSTNNSLLVFASQGVWEVTGSTGIGFAATDYTVKKISSSQTNSALSFIEVGGMPVWWGLDDIYIAASDTRLGGISIQSLSAEKIKGFYEGIPDSSRSFAKGSYNNKDKVVYWLYRSTAFSSNDTRQDYDSILVWNTRTNSFSPWSFQNTAVKIKGISTLQGSGQALSREFVTDDGVVVGSSLGSVYVTAATPSILTAQFKYTVVFGAGSLSYAQHEETDVVDWSSLITGGVTYSSFFTSGYRIRGDAMRDSQSNYVTIYATSDNRSKFLFSSLWDYAIEAIVKRWGTPQVVNVTNQNFTYAGRRLKIRGHGKAVQYKVESIDNEDFEIIGWSVFDTVNSGV